MTPEERRGTTCKFKADSHYVFIVFAHVYDSFVDRRIFPESSSAMNHQPSHPPPLPPQPVSPDMTVIK
ncbi:hypothetical protein EYF80_060617 [Liparis tanakae]|uniref:Uncharacterized protein n=1 Tax=Liparis tanakae TaxID=230148 RepID=A0A4Z2EKG0_9TELE|nr:hypothetical protein EYF80_060617 [Liparis tanakae]